jgi:acetolactate synthase small subunit
MAIRKVIPVALCVMLALNWTQLGLCKDDEAMNVIMAEVYMAKQPVKMKAYVQQVYRDVLFSLTRTLDNVPDVIRKVDIDINPQRVTVQVNGDPLEIRLFIEELYREIGIGILRAMGESPDRGEDYRIILYAT